MVVVIFTQVACRFFYHIFRFDPGVVFSHVTISLLSCVIIGRVLYRAVRQCHNGGGVEENP